MPGFNYNGEGAANTGLSVNDAGNSLARSWGINPAEFSGYRVENGRVIGVSRNSTVTMDGVTRPAETDLGYANDLSSSLNQGNGSQDTGRAMVLKNGQMGYWDTRTTGVKNEHTTRVFIAVGPSEAEKAATAAKALKEKQQAEAAAAAAAQKAAANAAAAAEKARQDAVAAGALAGQSMSVSNAQTALNNATADVTRLNQAAQAAASTAAQKRQAANNASTSAINAENTRNNLQAQVSGMSVKDGKYGRWNTRTTGGKNEHTTTTFASSGITVAQVDAAKANAATLRAQANQLAADAMAAETASTNAVTAARDAETRRQAAAAALSSAQRSAEAERQRQASAAAAAAAAEQKRLADIANKAAEAARIAAEQEKAHRVRQEAANTLKSPDIQSVRGISNTAAPATVPLAWATASRGGISLGSDVVASVWSQFTVGLAKLRGIMAASMVGPFAFTVGGLLYSTKVGVGSDLVPGRDISTLMPGAALSLPDTATLNNAADQKKGVAMPVRGRTLLRENGTLETQLVRTPVAGTVPVVRAVLDKPTGYWGYTLPAMPGVPAQTILVSPANAPGSNGPLGLSGPVPLPEKFLHTGDQDIAPGGVTTTTTPVLGDVDFRDLILIFPAESGLQPLYVMQNSPYGDATDKGKHSGRPYNPDKAGGPVQDLNWRGVVIDQSGIDKVKLHTRRFGESAANKVMIDRLEKILSGQLQVTDTDKRFYTHELRELERYRALGVPDNVKPDDKGVTWNNTHTATLEDYKINEKTDPLYTKDAEEAEYKAELKNN